MTGYKDPPQENWFKKGLSGNPKGRPKGSKNTLKLIEEILEQKITIMQDGKPFKISKKIALILQLVNNAIKGNIKATTALFPYMFQIDDKKIEEEKDVSFQEAETFFKNLIDNYIKEKNDE